MSCILSIYCASAFKEYLMPAVKNADTSIMLSKSVFSLYDDVELPMENIENKWHIEKLDEGYIHYTISKLPYEKQALQDGDLLTLTLLGGQVINIIVKEVKESFHVYQKFDISNITTVTIGKNDTNMLQYNNLNLVSREHCNIVRRGNTYILQDTSANGVFVNEMRINQQKQLVVGDCINVFGLSMVFLGNVLAVDMDDENLKIKPNSLIPYTVKQILNVENKKDNKEASSYLFHRSPRKIHKIDTEKVEIEAPPQPKEKDKQSIAMIIGPSLTMALPMLLGCSLTIYSASSKGNSSAFMFTGLVTAITSALVGTVWALVNMRYARKKTRQEELHRFEAYSEYLIRCANTVKEKYENNMNALREMYPSSQECCQYTHDSMMLWNRNVTHSDVLFERLGIGNIPFQVEIDIPKERFTMINDSLAEKPRKIKESYKMLFDVPVGIDLLAHPLIGVFGGEKKEGAIAAVYNLVAQIAANNCYTDVKMAFIYDEKKYDYEKTWSFAKWLPHVWSGDRRTRYVAKNKSEASDVLYELTKVLRTRQEESDNYLTSKNEKMRKPYYIIFVANPELLEGELITKYIFDPKTAYGMTTLLMETDYYKLPNACKQLIQNDQQFQGVYAVDAGEDEKIAINFDTISPVELEFMARRLANIEVAEIETGGEIPNALTFFEMYHVNSLKELNVKERWRKNRTYESMKALIGQKSGGVDCYLDVHEKYHGPHGLVAGTTGSGKSETLQTYMLSLALNFSPDDVGFFVIDYKGGGMANLFSGLPHMIGQISNLSGNQVHRAMVSIKSENMRRQRIFNEHGVNNINLYTKLYKNNEAKIPVPHMFIIIDEFAELKREEPDFMRELISVAQVGRSLGVHLILATQKPSGTVDDNIWSNSKFKLCLRVQDRQDSMDMLHKPDAAYIIQAGRCYLQVGNDELYELFQSGYSGATYDEHDDKMKTEIASMISDTGKAEIIGNRAKMKRKEATKKSWVFSLLIVANEATKKMHTSLANAVADYNSRDKLADTMFDLLEERQIEYPRSEYNTHRLEDLFVVLANCMKEPYKDLEELAVRVIALANASGKKLPEKKEKTQLDAVVEYLAETAKENGYVHNLQLWLPVLPTELYLTDLDGYEKVAYADHVWKEKETEFNLSVHMGLCDDPVNQAQMPLILDLAENGHHAICGTVVSGKSTFLQTMIYSILTKYTPAEVNIYGIDYGSKLLSCFEQAPQVGGVVYEGEAERLDKLLTMISAILAERKKLFSGGNFSQYVQANGKVIPAIVLAIDGFGNFRAKTECAFDDYFVQLAKEGVSYGIFIVMTAAGFSALEIPNRIGDNLRTVITLEMGDKFAYADALKTMRIDVLPEENVKGRGLVRMGDSILEYQTALALKAENDFERAEAIARVAEDMKAHWSGRRAKPIPEIPEDFNMEDFMQTEEAQSMLADDRNLPIGYNEKNVAIYGINLALTYCYLLTGKSRSGKTNALKVMMQSAAAKGGKVIVIDYAGELKLLSESINATYISDDRTLYNYFNKDLLPVFKERNKKKKEWIAQGFSDEEIYQGMSREEKIFFFIGNMPDFIQHIYYPTDGVGAMNSFVENLLDKGSMHNVFWFGVVGQDDVVNVSGQQAFTLFTRYKKGLHFGGNVQAQRLFNFDYVPYSMQSKSEKTGIAMVPAAEEETVRKVVLPLAQHKRQAVVTEMP